MTTPIKQQLQKGEVYKYQSINQHPEQQQRRSDDQKGEKKMDQKQQQFWPNNKPLHAPVCCIALWNCHTRSRSIIIDGKKPIPPNTSYCP